MKTLAKAVLICVTIFLSISAPGFPQGEKVVMASLEWPPYSGKALPGMGASVAVATAAFAAAGYDLEVVFFPWARTLKMAKTRGFDGYFPEYYDKHIEEEFIFSEPIGSGPLGFAERADAPIVWNSLSDLTSVGRIGTVRGYVNEATFDEMVEHGEIEVEPVVDDATNLRKLLANRITLAVIDKNVMQFILASDATFSGKETQLAFNPRVLGNRDVFLCFQKTARGRELAAAFNKGLKEIDPEKISREYFSGLLK